MATMYTTRALIVDLTRHNVQLPDTYAAVRELLARPYLPRLTESVSEQEFTERAVTGTLDPETYRAYLLDRAILSQRVDPGFGLDYFRDLRDVEARKLIVDRGADIAEQLRTQIRDQASANRAAHQALMAEEVTSAELAMRHRDPSIAQAWSTRLHSQEEVRRLESFLAGLIEQGICPVDDEVRLARVKRDLAEVEKVREAFEGDRYKTPEERNRLQGTR